MEIDQFTSLKPKNGGNVHFGDNSKGRVIGIGSIGNKSLTIHDVLLVDGLKHNLLSISQLSNKRFKVVFQSMCCEVIESRTSKIAFIGHRHLNVYIVDFCDIASMDVIAKLSKRDLVHGLPKLVLKKDHVCDACVKGKQTRVCFNLKNVVSTSRPLQLLHIDLCGPTM